MTLLKRMRIGKLVDGSIGLDISKLGVSVDVATRAQLLLSTRYNKRAQYLLQGTSPICGPSSSVNVSWPEFSFVPFIDYQRVSIGSPDYYATWEGDEKGETGIQDRVDITKTGATFYNWATTRSCYYIYTAYRVGAGA